MKTIVYIDGYNFYYGLLRNTAYKWLDIVGLVKHVCHIQNPGIDVKAVKFFTAPVITRVATQVTRLSKLKIPITKPFCLVTQVCWKLSMAIIF